MAKMNVPGPAREVGVLLLTQTHVGTGQAAGAVDLPVVRERHTGYPFLPSTAIKGVLRDVAEQAWDRRDEQVLRLFGPPPPQHGSEASEALVPGALIFTDALLLAFPVRSLSAPCYWVTCPDLIQRWRRRRLAWDLKVKSPKLPATAVASFTKPTTVVLEDVPVTLTSGHESAVRALATEWAELAGAQVPEAFVERLVVVPDATFAHLVSVGTSVQARVQLTDGKTTDQWTGDDGRLQKGNLWYEETLPPDCLFSFLLDSRKPDGATADLLRLLERGRRLQIGGNETIGYGQAWWTAEGGA